MPIVVTYPPSGAPFGPGFLIQFNTTTIGPFQDPSWRVIWTPDDGFDGEVLNWTYSTADPHAVFTEFWQQRGQVPLQTAHAKQGTTGHLVVSLFSAAIESETITVPVQAEWLIGNQFQLGQATQESGALTPTQAQQLEQTHESTYPAVSLDALTLSELTAGPQGGVVAAQLALWIFGVIVRIATVPPEFRVDTADGDYWVRSLAVVRIYRGSDLWKRVPVHTSSKMISFVDEGLIVAVASITTLQWLAQISIQVSFAEGVTGRVFLMRAP